MKVNFVTSGFPDGFSDSFISELKKYLGESKRFVFVASDFGMHEKTRFYLERVLSQFQEKGIDFEDVRIIDNSVTPNIANAFIENADVVWLAGGSTLMQIAHIKEYGLVPALQKRSGITIGMSAGAINMARRVVLAKDLSDNVPVLSVYEGIGLVDFNIEPHFNPLIEERFIDIQEAAKLAPIYAIHDETFIVALNGEMTIFGRYRLFNGIT